MDLSQLNGVPYFMEVFSRWARELPEQVMLVDDLTFWGWTRRRVDEVSGQVYDYLARQGIGREDFVLIKLPRGVLPVIAMIGVWKAGLRASPSRMTKVADLIESDAARVPIGRD